MSPRKLLRYGAFPVLMYVYYSTLMHLDARKDLFPYEAGLILFIYLVLYSFWKEAVERYADRMHWK